MPEKPVMTKLDPAEKSRTYYYPDYAITVENVVAVCVRDSGTHRLETVDGKKWIVQPGWLAIEIDTPEWTF